jgi:hypothetical protein
LALRHYRDAGKITDHGLRVARGRLKARICRVIRGRFTHEANGRFARHLLRNEPNLLRFLDHPDLEATNWPAEQAIRPAVVDRKSAGGSRSPRGAQTQATLMSLFRSAHQKNLDHVPLFTAILQAPHARSTSPSLELRGSGGKQVQRKYRPRQHSVIAFCRTKKATRLPHD